MTRETLSLMAGALSLALAASPNAGGDPPAGSDAGARALLGRVEMPAGLAAAIGGSRSVTGEEALLGRFAGGPSDGPVSVSVADRDPAGFDGVQALLGQQ